MTGTVQHADATDNARVTQVGRDYYQYVRGWEYLRGLGVDNHEMDFVKHAFVDPPGAQGSGQVAHAVSLLRRAPDQRHVLVILGETGVGRRTAALRVLRDVGVAQERIRWLVLDWDRPRTEQIPHSEEHGFVLDLTNCSSLSEDFYTGLADYEKEAAEAGAFLVILTTDGVWAPGALTTVPSVRLARPPAKDVAEAHLRHLAPDRVDWLTSHPLDELLAKELQASAAARLAHLVAGAPENGRDAVKQEFTGWQEHLRIWFEKYSGPQDLRERALLVAAALLEGVPAEVVLEAADQLFKEVGGVLPAGGALAGRDLDVRLKAINASPAEDQSVSLNAERHGLAEAVLQYVWRQRPPLRRVLLEWASHISAPGGIAVGHLHRIAESLAQLALLPGGATVLSVASGWIETGRVAHRQLAVDILEAMALHPVTGSNVRRQLYEWAGQRNTSEALAEAVADICAGGLGQKYPRIALTRLRVLASRPDGLARQAVAKAMHTLASDPEQRLPVLSEVVRWAESTGTVRQTGVSTFLALTDITSDNLLPLPVAQEAAHDSPNGLAGQLFIRGWHAALREPDTAETAYRRLAAWLDSPQLPDTHVTALAAAVLRRHLSEESAAKLLVGCADSSDLGRARRRMLLDQLISEQTTIPTSPGAASEPSSEGALA